MIDESRGRPAAPAPAPEPAPSAPALASWTLRVLFALVGVLSVAWLALTWQLVSASSHQRAGLAHFSAAQETYHAVYGKASQLLKRGSDTLTEDARRYVVTGDRAHLDAFFDEADGTRSRNHALELVDSALAVSDEARGILHAAMAASDALFVRECRALHLRAAAKGVPEEKLPPRLRAVPLSPEDRALDPEEQRKLSVRLLFDDDYFAAKADVWDHVNEFLDQAMDEQMRVLREDAAATQAAASGQTRIITMRLVTLFLLLALAVAAALAVIAGKNRANLRLMEELRRERDATLAAEKAKSMFFSMVSHDIRTPLNSIVGYSELLLAGVDDPKERAENLGNVLFSARTLLALVNDVLDLSKLDADKMVFSSSPVDLPALLARVADSFRFRTEEKGISIRVAAGAMPRLSLDEDRIRQVLVNLAGNAVKFTEKGGVDLEAEFAPGAAGRGALTLRVRDTGIGIAPDFRERVFEPFVQAESSRTSGGTGLGLPICRSIVERLGGTISLESEPGKGSTFTVSIPDVETAAAETTTEHTENTENAATTAADGKTSEPSIQHSAFSIQHSPSVRSILVVDDVPVNVKVEQAMLKRAGVADVATALSGAEALRLLGERAFDLVLTDLWMPEMDGYALCGRIREEASLAGLPVYAVTADVEAGKAMEGKGFDGLLLKPLTMDKLSAFLANLRPSAA